jgi:hypothetical protein
MKDKDVNTPDVKKIDLDLSDEVDDQNEDNDIFKWGPKTDLNPYDIFKLAKGILIVAAGIYVLFALIRIFYNDASGENSGVKEVWEYSKVVLNSIVSLVLGLYFGSKQDAKSRK